MIFCCAVATAPLRAEPEHKAEMVSQLLFGEEVKQITLQDNWIKVKCLNDNYEGWVEKNSMIPFEEQSIDKKFKKHIASKLSSLINSQNAVIVSLLPGSEIYLDSENNALFNNHLCLFSGNTLSINDSKTIFNKTNLVSDAFQFLNTPYLWGGKSLFGADCSGFTQTIFKINGINIPKDANQQAELGKIIEFNKAEKGDVAFFKNNSGRVTHVGICLDNRMIIHCSIQVKIEKLDESGIWNEDQKKYSHQLAFIKRII